MRETLRILLLAVLLAMLAQAPFWVAQQSASIQRALFNLDMVLALIVTAWCRPLGLVLLCVAWLVEIARDVSRSFNFVGTADFIGTARFADLVGLRYVLSWKVAFGMAGLAACLWLIRRLLASSRASRPRLAAALFTFACLCGAADALNGSNGVFGFGADRFALGVNIAGSAGWNILRDEMAARKAAGDPMQRFPEASTFRRALAWKHDHPDRSVLLVLVESMGLPRSPALQDWLYARLQTAAVTQRWNVERSSEAFYGPTTYGELRVLCGLRGYYTRLKPSDETQCLPQAFTRLGQPSFGLHGFSLRMFDREQWWPALGIAPQGFGGDERVRGNFGCNDAFPGVCDAVVLRHAVALADAPGRFVYAVTLDTHLPLPWKIKPVRADLQKRCDAEHVSAVACRMVDRLGTVLDQLAAGLGGMRLPPLVLVVGDHVPPFVQREDRGAFDAARVTQLVLQPRESP